MELTIKFDSSDKFAVMGAMFHAFQELDPDFEDSTNYIGEDLSSITLEWSEYWEPVILEFYRMVKESVFVEDIIIQELKLI